MMHKSTGCTVIPIVDHSTAFTKQPSCTIFATILDGDTDAANGEANKDEPQADTGVDGEEGKQEAVEDGEWEIPYSDEEMEDPKNWMPPPAEIKRLYEILAKGEMLELDFVPLPRRSLTPERKPSPERDDEDDAAKEREREERERKSVLLLLIISSLRDFVGIADDKPLYFFPPGHLLQLSLTLMKSKCKPLPKAPSSTDAEHQV